MSSRNPSHNSAENQVFPKKRKKKLEEVNPSSENIDNEKKLPDIYKPKQGLGFFGYVFLIIIVGFY